MRKGDISEDEELGILEDKTEALTLHSKRTERSKKKMAKRIDSKAARQQRSAFDLLALPYELLSEIISFLRPSDLFKLQRVNRALHLFITREESDLARIMTSQRYPCLSKCYRLPVPLAEVDPAIHPDLLSEERQELMTIHRKPYQHIQSPDPREICTCLTCMLRWSALNLIVDFAHWQGNLDQGEPIPMIPRGSNPEWNSLLISRNAGIVRKALKSPLWYSLLLEIHLDSTTRAISRHSANKGNRRKRFRMTEEDLKSGTDEFLERSGPPSFDFPFHRDNYYMLEAYLPNRGWSSERGSWMYVPEQQHERDIEFVTVWAERRRKKGGGDGNGGKGKGVVGVGKGEEEKVRPVVGVVDVGVPDGDGGGGGGDGSRSS